MIATKKCFRDFYAFDRQAVKDVSNKRLRHKYLPPLKMNILDKGASIDCL